MLAAIAALISFITRMLLRFMPVRAPDDGGAQATACETRDLPFERGKQSGSL